MAAPLTRKRGRIALYQPHTPETQRAYTQLVTEVRYYLPPGAEDTILELTEDIIRVLRDTDLPAATKHRALEQLFGGVSITEQVFQVLLSKCHELIDFVASGAAAEQQEGEIQFEVSESSDNDGEGELKEAAAELEEYAADVDTFEEPTAEFYISFAEASSSVKYLESELYKLCPTQEPAECAAQADRIIQLLSDKDESRHSVEAQLMTHLMAYENEALQKWVGSLVESRWAIVYGQKYAMTLSQPEHIAKQEQIAIMQAIEEHGQHDSSARALYEQITGQQARTGDEQQGGIQRELKVIDLEMLVLESEGVASAGVKPVLSRAHKVSHYEHHDEIALPAPPAAPADELRISISSFPEWARPVFLSTPSLNPMQSKIYETAMNTSQNLLICAPTGAGKTNVAMMAILQVLNKFRDPETNEFATDFFKMVYVAPMKALVQEVVRTFGERLAPLGISVAELSGDHNLSKDQMTQTQLIVTTPEKWDIVTRKSIDQGVATLVRLLIVDEVHLLHNDRGAVLESIVARTKLQVERTCEEVRLVGLSATLPNYEDVGKFLGCDIVHGLFHFDGSYRPVPLTQTFAAIKRVKPGKRLTVLNDVLYEKVLQQAKKGAQVLVFVHSRKDTEHTARYLLQKAKLNNCDDLFSMSRATLQEAVAQNVGLRDALMDLLPNGFGIHNAGLSPNERKEVEKLFRERHLRVLVCTSTLAWGVNLPAHAVIIRGTQVYNAQKGGWTSLSALDVLQMFGRAGRPGLDSSGEAIIITSQEELPYYLGLLGMQLPIESRFIGRLVDAINAEVMLGTIRSVSEGAKWLKYTYLFVRMLKNPRLYGARRDPTDKWMLRFREDLIHSAFVMLEKQKMIRYDHVAREVKGTELGRIASFSYVTVNTIETLHNKMHPFMHDADLLAMFSRASEFQNLNVRVEEKEDVRKLSEQCPIAVMDPPDSKEAKVNVLLQCYISNMTLHGMALMTDMVYIKDSAQRLLKAIYDVAVWKRWGDTANRALAAYLMTKNRQWEVQSPLRQLSAGLTNASEQEELSKIVDEVEKWKVGWNTLCYYDIDTLMETMKVTQESRATEIHTCIHTVPRVWVDSTVVKPLSRSMLSVWVKLMPDFRYVSAHHGRALQFAVSVEGTDGCILHYDTVDMREDTMQDSNSEMDLSFVIPVTDPKPTHVFLRIRSLAWLGCTATIPIDLRAVELPEKPAKPTEPKRDELALSSLKEFAPFAQKLFPDLDYFNSLQSDAVLQILTTRSNVFVGFPPGCGKTVCGELFVLQFLQQCSASGNVDAKLLYITPTMEQAKRRFMEWKIKFGEQFHQRVGILDNFCVQASFEVFAQCNVVLATPACFERLARRPNVPGMQQITHIIFDHLHMLWSARFGPSYESFITKMLRVYKKSRLLGLSYSLLSSMEVSEWLRVSASSSFNFSPVANRRSTIQFELCDVLGYHNRFAQTCNNVLNFLQTPKARKMRWIVFVPTVRDAEDLATTVFQLHREVAAPVEGLVEDEQLSYWVAGGVAALHSGTSEHDFFALMTLAASDASSNDPLVLFTTFADSWRIPASLFDGAVICGAEEYDAALGKNIDCPVVDMLQMISRADTEVIVYCQSTKLFFWQKFLLNPVPMESQILSSVDLEDPINTAICDGRAVTMGQVVALINSHLCAKRMKKNPAFYGLTSEDVNADWEVTLSSLADDTISALVNQGLIERVEEDEQILVQPKGLGLAAYHHCIPTEDVVTLLQLAGLKNEPTVSGIVNVLSECALLMNLVKMRKGDDKKLRSIANGIPGKRLDKLFLAEERLSLSHKIQILIVASCCGLELASLHYDTVELQQDSDRLVAEAHRLVCAAVDIVGKSSWKLCRCLMQLAQSLIQGVWFDSPDVGQLPNNIVRLIPRYREIDKLRECSKEELVEMLGENDAKLVIDALSRLPHFSSFLKCLGRVLPVGEEIHLQIDVACPIEGASGNVYAPKFKGNKRAGWWVACINSENEEMLAVRYIPTLRNNATKLQFAIPEMEGDFGFEPVVVVSSDCCLCESRPSEVVIELGETEE